MRFLLILLVALGFGASSMARAQIFQVTASGLITGAGGIFSSVPNGTPYTFEATFNAANATLISSTSSSATYADPAGTSSFSFAGFSFNGIAPQIQVTSDDVLDDGEALYGFEFSQFLAVGGYAVQLLSLTPSVAPTTSLSSLHAETFAEYQNSLNLGTYNGVTSIASGKNTSFSVQTSAAPEPLSIALAVIAIGAFGLLRWRQVRAS